MSPYSVRIVTYYPAPSELADYEPFIKKGSGGNAYGYSILENPSDRELRLINKKVTLCKQRGIHIGCTTSTLDPKLIIISQKKTPDLWKDPKMLPQFVTFAANIGSRIFAIGGDSPPITLKLGPKHATETACSRDLPNGELWGGKDKTIDSAKNRAKWIDKLKKHFELTYSQIVVISDQPEDEELIEKISYSINIDENIETIPNSHIHLSTRDFGFIALLLYGRDITNFRKTIL